MGYIQDQPLHSVEADFGDGPTTVYFREMSLFEMGKIQEAEKLGMSQTLMTAVFWRARDERGARLFTKPADKDRIMKEFDPKGIIRLVADMNNVDEENDPSAGKSG